MTNPSSPGLHRFAVVTAAATYALLFIGGLVTSTGSSLAVPDWPLSFGQVFPPMEGGVLFEHGHRLAATAVGCLTLVLALWTVVREPRPGVRALALLALFAVVLQGILGGITVLYRLPVTVSVTHACLAQLFFCLVVSLAVVTAPGWAAPAPRPRDGRLAALAAATTVMVFVQVLLGALVRHLHAGLAIPDFPLAFGRVVPPLVTTPITVHFTHRIGAVLVAVLVGSTAVRALGRRGEVTLRRPAWLALGLLVLQFTLGALTIWSQRSVVPTTLHLVVGAGLLATSLVLALHARRGVAARDAARPVPFAERALA